MTSSVIEPVLPDSTYHSSSRGTAVTWYEIYKWQKCGTRIYYDGLKRIRSQYQPLQELRQTSDR